MALFTLELWELNDTKHEGRRRRRNVKQHNEIIVIFLIYLWKNIFLDSDWDIRHINIDIYTILFHKYKIIYKGQN